VQYSGRCTQSETYFGEESGSLPRGIFRNRAIPREFPFSWRVSVPRQREGEREGSCPAERCLEFITALVCFVLKLAASGPFNFTLPSFDLKLIARLVFAFCRGSQLRLTERADAAIFQTREKREAGFGASFWPCTRFVSRDSPKNGLPIDYEDPPASSSCLNILSR